MTTLQPNDTSDAWHFIGGDFTLLDTGALQMAQGGDKSRQRILRRLCTNPGDYIAHPSYGAGLPQKIGSPEQANEIAALVRAQMYLEPSVSRIPVPVVTVTEQPGNGSFFISISYTEAATQLPLVLSFDPADPPGTASSLIQPQGT